MRPFSLGPVIPSASEGSAFRQETPTTWARLSFAFNSRFLGLRPRNDNLRVAAQPKRELLQLPNAARLGATAPVLQLLQQLLARGIGTLPQRHQFPTHGVD